jgi:hypothetical protein
MKQLIGRAASEVLWFLGDWISRPMYYWDWDWIYPAYNWLMDSSYQIQVWAGNNSPWHFGIIKDKE